MEPRINNSNDLRAAVAVLTSKVNNMCNVTTTEDVAKEFSEAKDLLVAIFKYNVDRVHT